MLKTLNDGRPLPKFTKQPRRYSCVQCRGVISQGVPTCQDCGAHVHQLCAEDHARVSSALHLRFASQMNRTYERNLPPEDTSDSDFASALALEVAEHDAVLDLLAGDWPETWPTDDPLLAGRRLGDQFRAAIARRG
ncbi:hypothetical protein [Branchiibius sp. NY16-3462-2]|uniref:hypothetical protein n=1 Tax=Branchiibius sp. NY16-3462-2 TaxID=1807500 RepID=UPI0007930B57|nr:hypothetical protein [Branchiibius sp. NY16-3462-2]KYH43234.1 hypothetical protein AZH51_12835 [Branchiibius sp. NY16-3462-2]